MPCNIVCRSLPLTTYIYLLCKLLSRLAKAWDAQQRDGALVSALDRETQNLEDILKFVCSVERQVRGKKNGAQLSPVCKGRLARWRSALLHWFSDMADKVVLGMYLDNAKAKDHVPPSQSFQTPNKRKYTMMSPEGKWLTIVDARRVRTNPSTVLALRSDLANYGCHEDSADAWLRKEQQMYLNRTAVALSGASHAIPCPPAPSTYIHTYIHTQAN